MVYVWAMLQGLCGLRMLEAAYLREEDIDFVNRTITITENSAHKPKTNSSYRKIPICDAVAGALKDWIAGLKVRHPEGYIFTPQRVVSPKYPVRSQAARVGVYTLDGISHLWTRTIRRARIAGVPLPEQFVARKLRATFTTAMRRAGVDFGILQKYIGHAPNSVLLNNYDYMDTECLRTICRAAQHLYEGKGIVKQQFQKQTLQKVVYVGS